MSLEAPVHNESRTVAGETNISGRSFMIMNTLMFWKVAV